MARPTEHVRRAIRAAAVRLPELFSPGSRVVVAFSGGQDSTCLLHALAHSHRKLDLLAAHVDHALRKDSADAARQAVKNAEAIGVRCAVTTVDVASYRAGLRGWSVEQAARAARYHALASIIEQTQAQALLVAHTADDQAETLLLHLLRGSGLDGLKGMRLDETIDLRQLGPKLESQPLHGTVLRVVRPLLGVPRSTTLAYCMQFGLSLVEDASNQTRIFNRNRVRLDVLPALERLNPAIRTTLARTAALAADEAAALDAIVAQIEPQLKHPDGYDLRLWRAQPRAFQRRLLRRGLASLVGGLVDVTDAPIEDALDLLQTAQPNQTYHLPYGVELCISSRKFCLQLHGRARARQSHQLRNTWGQEVPRV
jgi:tRNA(Ile)-lysidine synthetase-like protein